MYFHYDDVECIMPFAATASLVLSHSVRYNYQCYVMSVHREFCGACLHKSMNETVILIIISTIK